MLYIAVNANTSNSDGNSNRKGKGMRGIRRGKERNEKNNV